MSECRPRSDDVKLRAEYGVAESVLLYDSCYGVRVCFVDLLTHGDVSISDVACFGGWGLVALYRSGYLPWQVRLNIDLMKHLSFWGSGRSRAGQRNFLKGGGLGLAVAPCFFERFLSGPHGAAQNPKMTDFSSNH